MPRHMTPEEADDHWTEHGDDARPDEMFEDRSPIEASASVGAVTGVVEALREKMRRVVNAELRHPETRVLGFSDEALDELAALARYEASLGSLPSASQPSVPTEQGGGAVVGWCRPVSEEEMRYIEMEVRQCREAERLGIRRVMDVSPETIAALAHTACELTAEVDFLKAELSAARQQAAVSPDRQVGIANGDEPEKGWIVWHGGANPAPGEIVEIECRDGSRDTDASEHWTWDSSIAPIVRYRVIAAAPTNTTAGKGPEQ